VYIYYITNQLEIPSASSWKFLSGQVVYYGKDRQYGLSITYKIKPAGSLFSSQPGGPPCWASPLAFGLIGRDPRRRLIIRKNRIHDYHYLNLHVYQLVEAGGEEDVGVQVQALPCHVQQWN
jgi:hypothetical protein